MQLTLKKSRCFMPLFVWMVLHSLSAEAAVASVPDDSITMQRIDDVVIEARRSPIKVSTAAPVQTLSGTELTRLGIQNMADAVRRFAGANVRDYGGVGGLKTVSVRNMGAAHTGVSYDGAPVSNCQAGQIDIGRFSLDNVSMLSLAIGQNEDLLQPAKLYASAGVLSIVTQRPVFDGDDKSAFQVKIKGGSFGYITPAVRWWQKLGENTVTSLEGDYMRADGNYPFRLVNGKYVTEERRNNSAITSWHGEGNLYHTFADSSNLQVKGYYYYSKRGLPGPVTLYNPVSDETLWDKNAFVQVKYRKEFSDKWNFQAQAKYNYGWNRDRDLGPQYSDGVYSATHRQNEYYVTASAVYRPVQPLQIALAQDAAVNTLHSTMPECPFPTRYTSLTALNVRYRLNGLTVNGVLLGTYINERVKAGKKPDDLSRLSPGVSVSVQPWRDEQLYFRVMYKSTFRTPTFNDLYYYRLGNRKLRPEKADEYNIGVTWSILPASFMDYLSFTVDGYFNNVTDKIVAFPTTYAWTMANYGKVHVTGVDITLASAFSLSRKVQLTLSGAYTFQKAVDLTDPDSKSYKHQLPYTPRHSGNVSAVIDMPWVDVGYSIVGVGKRYCLSQNIPVNKIDGYAEHTLTLSHEFLFRGYRLDLQGEIINLTDKQYDVIKYYPMPGRSWRVTGTFKF